MLLFVVARDDPDRYRDLRHWFRGREDVTVVMDRRFGERRREDQPWPYERRASQRRRNQHVEQELALLGWSVVEAAGDDHAQRDRRGRVLVSRPA